ncbi:Na(+)-translocating NADH-quinone reductase subunit C [Stieleria sp. TO1_6]|uniref:Na(+)-translocating NADH-quinone reductase subunit C n=1 Tax=Stieleria tagensis TaxID=2956795 RepID=UPI00209B2825|nr:Na(+)-translocating NADH-quinone reductase subunit C [Stieleria tagensis]MCO8121032.1 Na(+)-translocating NADH-quinone reductase subunit C [Stieleria tagensis]
MPQRDSVVGTLLTATVLCVVCSLVVSVAAVGLKDKQEQNKTLDRQKNILDAAGLAVGEFGKPSSELSKDQIDDLYKRVSEQLVDLETGKVVTDMNVADYDPREAAEKKDSSIEITNPEFDPGVKRREKIAKIYLVGKQGEEPTLENYQQIVLPVYGKGLWSTLYGYLALKQDLKTIQGLTFYEHAETPGLGGEVDNPAWKSQWEDKSLYDADGNPAALVYKGSAPSDNPYAVDGLSGATITSRGVTNLLRYWAGDNGYGPFLKALKNDTNTSSQTAGI